MRLQTTLLLSCGLGLTLLSVASAQSLNDDDLPFKQDPNGGDPIPLFMHDGTFAGDTGWSWARDNVELEATYTVTGVDGLDLYRVLMEDGQKNFERVQAGENWRGGTKGRQDDEMFALDAFSVGYGGWSAMSLDEVPWSKTHHAIREGKIPWEGDAPVVQPYVWITIEDENFEPVPVEGTEADTRWGGRRRLDLATDTMDDIYYDTPDYLLMDNGLSIRGRKRFSDVSEVRRLLVALKMDRGVDEFGIKKAAKVDIRSDGPSPEEVTGLDEAVMQGRASWESSPAVPLRRAWNYLRERNKLPSSPTYKHVLAMKPQAFIRSFRARFHFNECSLDAVRSVYEQGRSRLESLITMAREARQDNAVDPSRVAEVEAFEKKARATLDNIEVLDRSRDKLKALGFEAADVAAIGSLLPGAAPIPSGESLDDIAARKVELDQRRVVAETISDLFHELSADLDDGSSESLRRVITRSLDRKLEQHAELFVDWQRETKMGELGRVHSMDPFVAAHEAMLGDAQALADFNAYAKEHKEDELTQEQFDALRFHLRNEEVRIWMRQIEEAGSAARGLWFDNARSFYVPRSARVTSNFLIDTIDFPTMYDADVWGDTPMEQRNPGVNLDQAPYRDHLVHSALVNEVQIELTSSGTEYPRRLRQLRATVDLPREFMNWAEATGQAKEHATWKALYDEMAALPTDNDDAALQERLAPLNEWIEHHGGRILNYEASEFREWMNTDLLTEEVKDPNYELPNLQTALDGAMFVFAAYRDMLSFVARLKEPRIKKVLDRAGIDKDTFTWQPAVASKGNTALSLLRDGKLPTPDAGGGLIDVLGNTNHTSAGAAVVERKAYSGREVASGRDDWYRIDLAPGESVRFTIDFDTAKGDLDLELLREDGGKLHHWSSSETTSNQETVSYTTSSGRTVWLRVHGYQTDAGRYNLTVE